MELFDLGKAIEAQLYGSHRDLGRHPFFAAHPDLITRLVSKLTYCVREEPVRYIAVDMTQASHHESFSIAVYTDDHMFYLIYDPSVDHISTTILGRQAVEILEVLSAPNFMIDGNSQQLGPSVTVSATYPGFKVRLPGDNAATAENHAQLEMFLPSLLRDLRR